VDKSPDAFRTISEAAEELSLPQHVLRFWETRFSSIKPLKRGGGRRYYRPDDVLLLKGIRHLLYDQGFTIKGVQKILKDQGVRQVIAIGLNGATEPVTPANGETEALPAPNGAARVLNKRKQDQLSAVMRELLDCKRLLDSAREN
jgi:DNA-binding transcriptional MerR regulator